MPLLGRLRIASGSRSATACLSTAFSSTPDSLYWGGMVMLSSTMRGSNRGDRPSTPAARVRLLTLVRIWSAPLNLMFSIIKRFR